jgi:DNA-binding NtrC family response regulator
VIGETGSGKTGVAESIHLLSERAGGPWLTVNAAELAAGDPSIVMGKLFGVGRGSGLPDVPKGGRPGLLEDADGGTLFIDEVALLPVQAQHLLLLPVEGRPFRPVFTGAERRVDVKLIFATNRDLADEVDRGAFPRDLYERIAGETVRVPPLRERLDDVPVLADHFLAELRAEVGEVPGLSAPVLEALRGYDWPGNVRELRRLVRAAAKRARLQRAPRIEPAHLPDELRRAGDVPRSPSRPPAVEGFSEREAAEIEALRRADFKIAVAESRLGYSARSRTLSHRLRGMSFEALKLANWDVAAAAAMLAGDAGDLQGKLERRLRTLLDGLGERRGEPPEKLLAHLLAEHRPYAMEALTRAGVV